MSNPVAGTSNQSQENVDNQIGIQTGGKLHVFQVGHDVNDGIMLDVDTGEFDITELGMAESDEEDELVNVPNSQLLANQEKAKAQNITPIRHPPQSLMKSKEVEEKQPISREEYIRVKGDDAMKRIFDDWMSERMSKLTEEERHEQLHRKLAQNEKPITPKGKAIAPVVVKSPSDTTIYAPALHRRAEKIDKIVSKPNEILMRTNDNDIPQQIASFVDAVRIEADRRQVVERDEAIPGPSGYSSRDPPPGFEEAKERMKQSMVQAEKHKAAVAVPPGKNFVDNFGVDVSQQQHLSALDQEFFQTMQGGSQEETTGFDTQLAQPNLIQQGVERNPQFHSHFQLLQRNVASNLSDDDFFHLMCHIEPVLKAKIERGEYVDLEKLLPKQRGRNSDETRLEWVHREGDTFLVPASGEKENKINGIRRWDQAFRVYATIYCGAHPHRSQEIWQYVSVINTAATAYEWNNVANYDYTFRYLMEFNPGRSWATTYNQMWNLSMRDPLPKSHGYKQSFSTNMTGTQNNKGGFHSSKQSPSSYGVARKKKGKHSYCLYFNRGEKCKYGDRCRFVERCSQCDAADHHILVCPKLTKKE